MNAIALPALRTSLGMTLLLLSGSALAWNENSWYAGLTYSQVEIKNLPGNNTDTKHGALAANWGSYLNDYLRMELRGGLGIEDKTLSNGLTVGLDYYLSGMMGPTIAVTDYFTVYALFGITHLRGVADRTEDTGFDYIPGDLIESSFSTSVALGMTLRVWKKLHGTLEYGRLHSDTITDLDIKPLNVGILYEF